MMFICEDVMNNTFQTYFYISRSFRTIDNLQLNYFYAKYAFYAEHIN